MYALITRLSGLAVDLYYRRRHLRGTVPATGPLILVANHPNSLVDPIVVARAARRRVLMLGKAPLFDMPVIGLLMRGMHALPVYRAKDGVATDKNLETFSAVYDALDRGEAILLFPEGTSHSEPQLQPLKTGAARMALGAEARCKFSLGVKIAPVGIIYRDKARSRSEIATAAGEPILAASYRELYGRDEREAARALTADIDEALRALTINLDRWEDLPLLDMAAQIWRRDEGDQAERLRLLSDGARELRRREPARVQALEQRVAGFKARLDAVGLDPDALERRYRLPRMAQFVLRNLVALFIGLPAALIGTLAYGVPALVVRLLGGEVRELDVVATVKLLVAMVLYPLWHAALVSYLTYRWGVAVGLPAGIALPFCGLYARHFVERRADAWRELRLFFGLGIPRATRRTLRAERDRIAAEIEELAKLL